jgi:hypothetical protein
MRASRGLSGTAILLAGLFACGAAMAATPEPARPSTEKADRLGNAMAELLPMGSIFELVAKDDPNFPLGEKVDKATPEQLSCLRTELSVEGFRRLKRSEAEPYVRDNAARVDDDLKLLESGAARVMGRLVMGGAESRKTGTTFDPQPFLMQSKPEELASFMAFMTDPNYAELRKLSGRGEAVNPLQEGGVEPGNGKALGASLGYQYVLKAMGTCNVPTSVFL